MQIFENAWAKIIKAHPRMRGWKRSFIPQAFKEFGYFAEAWRNRSFHAPHVMYGEEEAERVVLHVRTFLKHLSTKIGEKKKIRWR